MRIGDRASWGAWSSYRSGVSALRAGAESVQAHEIAAVTSQVENAKDMARTRDGWTGSIQSMMGRMGELAVTANDGTLFAPSLFRHSRNPFVIPTKVEISVFVRHSEGGRFPFSSLRTATGGEAISVFDPRFRGDDGFFKYQLIYNNLEKNFLLFTPYLHARMHNSNFLNFHMRKKFLHIHKKHNATTYFNYSN